MYYFNISGLRVVFKMNNRHVFAVFLENIDLKFDLKKNSPFIIFDELFLFRINTVLRLRAGNQLIVFNNQSSFLFLILSVGKNSISLEPIEEIINQEPKIRVHLFLSFLKKVAFEEAVYFAAETGCVSITPVITEKSQTYFWSEKEKSRLNKLIISAKEQSKSFGKIELNEPIKISEIKTNKKDCPILICDPEGGSFVNLYKKFIDQKTESVGLLIGPEAGFSPKENEFFEELKKTNSNFYSVSLTRSILRAPEALLLASGILNLK